MQGREYFKLGGKGAFRQSRQGPAGKIFQAEATAGRSPFENLLDAGQKGREGCVGGQGCRLQVESRKGPFSFHIFTNFIGKKMLPRVSFNCNFFNLMIWNFFSHYISHLKFFNCLFLSFLYFSLLFPLFLYFSLGVIIFLFIPKITC